MRASDSINMRGDVHIEIRDAKTGKLKSVQDCHNVVVTTGKNAIADALRGTETSNRGIITYCALGTGLPAATESDTTLDTEIFRKLISVRSVTDNVAQFETFFTTSEANGTLKEAGLFGDAASGTADSGTLFCRVQINRTKTSNDTLSLTWTVTVG